MRARNVQACVCPRSLFCCSVQVGASHCESCGAHFSRPTFGARLDGKLPTEVASLVRVDDVAAAQSQGFGEESLQKARRILNGMIESAWLDLDAAIIDCRTFSLRNRKTYAQVVTDLNRLGAQVADLERKR